MTRADDRMRERQLARANTSLQPAPHQSGTNIRLVAVPISVSGATRTVYQSVSSPQRHKPTHGTVRSGRINTLCPEADAASFCTGSLLGDVNSLLLWHQLRHLAFLGPLILLLVVS